MNEQCGIGQSATLLAERFDLKLIDVKWLAKTRLRAKKSTWHLQVGYIGYDTEESYALFFQIGLLHLLQSSYGLADLSVGQILMYEHEKSDRHFR